jgi:ABC-2 type transport system permease protein
VIVARRLVLDRKRSFLWWCLGTGLFVASNCALYPSVRDVPAFKDLFEQLPKGMRTLFGTSSQSITSPAGYLNGRQYALILPVLIVMFAVALAAYATAGTEEDGTLEFTLALSVSRRRLAVERLAASLAMIVGLGLLSAVVLLVLGPAVGLLKGLGVGHIFVATGAVVGMATFFAGLAFGFGCLTGRRSTALGTAAAVAFYGYVFHGVAAISGRLHVLRLVSPWYWFLGQNTLIDGANPVSTIAPIVALALFVAVCVRHFESRDLR